MALRQGVSVCLGCAVCAQSECSTWVNMNPDHLLGHPPIYGAHKGKIWLACFTELLKLVCVDR